MSYTTNLNTYLNPTPETIVRRGNYMSTAYAEANASDSLTAPYPGMLIQMNSDGTVSVQTTAGANVPRMFAIEDALQGYTIDDQYSQGDVVRYVIAYPGMIIRSVIPAGQVTVVGSILQSYGDGSLAPVVASGGDVLYSSVANSTAITNTTTQTAFSNGSYVIPANSLQVGDVIQVLAQGKVTAQNSTDTLTARLLLGSTVVVATAAVDAAVNDVIYFEANLIVRTIGTSGTVVAAGVQANGVPGTVTAKPFYMDSTTLNTTANANLAVTAEWSVANTGNSVQLNVMEVKRLRVAPQGFLAMALEAVNNASGNTYEFVDVQIF